MEDPFRHPTAEEIIKAYDLQPHPEGGWYRQTWVAEAAEGERPAGTAIYFLLKLGERSHWHRVDAAETWHWYAGAPLFLCYYDGEYHYEFLGKQRVFRERLDTRKPQATVPQGAWQAARSDGSPGLDPDWTFCGCTVSPGFQFEGFELAERGWQPPPPEGYETNLFDHESFTPPKFVTITKVAAEALRTQYNHFNVGEEDGYILGVLQALGAYEEDHDGNKIALKGDHIGIGGWGNDKPPTHHVDTRLGFPIVYQLTPHLMNPRPITLGHDGEEFFTLSEDGHRYPQKNQYPTNP